MFGSLTAIISAGALSFLGRKRPELTGEGRLQPDEHDELDLHEEADTGRTDVGHIAGAAVTAISFYLLGLVLQRLIGLPAPVAMLFLAVAFQLTPGGAPPLPQGA